MNILILCVGSRGDVQPYLALSQGLQAAGHTVTLATNTTFETFVREHGVGYAPLQADFLEMMQTPAGKAALAGGNPLGLMKKVMPMLRRILDDAATAARGAQAVVYHPKALAGYHLAEKLGIPGFLSLPAPLLTPTRAFPSPVLPPTLKLGGGFNHLSHAAMLPLTTAPYAGLVNTWRRDALGLPPRAQFASELRREGRPVPVLYCYSREVVPVPADWEAAIQVTGYWFLDEAQPWEPPAELLRFLESGPAPVYVGFGSMATRDPRQTTDLVVAALQRSGQRGVIAAGWGGLTTDTLPDSVFALSAAPHDWLFPRMAAVVHHGGAGTTAAGLRAGRPSVICPFFGDQPFWGHRVQTLGVGPQPISQKQLTAERLAQAIQTAVADPGMRARAEALGTKLRAEDGVGRAVAIITEQLGSSKFPAAHR